MQGSQFSAWFVFEKEGFDIVSNEVSVINQSSQTISRSVNQSVSRSVIWFHAEMPARVGVKMKIIKILTILRGLTFYYILLPLLLSFTFRWGPHLESCFIQSLNFFCLRLPHITMSTSTLHYSTTLIPSNSFHYHYSYILPLIIELIDHQSHSADLSEPSILK